MMDGRLVSECVSALTVGEKVVLELHLHRRSFHSGHIGYTVQDSDCDGDGDKKAAGKRPDVAPPWCGLLSHPSPGGWKKTPSEEWQERRQMLSSQKKKKK